MMDFELSVKKTAMLAGSLDGIDLLQAIPAYPGDAGELTLKPICPMLMTSGHHLSSGENCIQII